MEIVNLTFEIVQLKLKRNDISEPTGILNNYNLKYHFNDLLTNSTNSKFTKVEFGNNYLFSYIF